MSNENNNPDLNEERVTERPTDETPAGVEVEAALDEVAAVATPAGPAPRPNRGGGDRGSRRGGGGGRGPSDRGPGRGPNQGGPQAEDPERSEWKEKVIQIRRVTKVVKGGKKLSFRADVVVGNGKG